MTAKTKVRERLDKYERRFALCPAAPNWLFLGIWGMDSASIFNGAMNATTEQSKETQGAMEPVLVSLKGTEAFSPNFALPCPACWVNVNSRQPLYCCTLT